MAKTPEFLMVHVNTQMIRLRRTIINLCAVVLPLGAVMPWTVQAQDGAEAEVNKVVEASVPRGLFKMEKKKVPISPAHITVTPGVDTATLTFTNPSEDTLETTIRVGLIPPVEFRLHNLIFDKGIAEYNKSARAEVKVIPKSSFTDESGNQDTIAADHSLAGWITGLPASLKLAPGEKKTITVKLTVPPEAKPGEYAAWIVTFTRAILVITASAEQHTENLHRVYGPQSTDRVTQQGAKIVYQHGKS